MMHNIAIINNNISGFEEKIMGKNDEKT